MYFAGHTHSYVRSLPSVNGSTETHHDRSHYADANATTHIVVGGAGCDEMPFIGLYDFAGEVATADQSPAGTYNRTAALASVPAGSAVEDVATAVLAVGVLKVRPASEIRPLSVLSCIGSHDEIRCYACCRRRL